MTPLGRKRWRDLRANLGPSIAVIAVLALGVMLFVSSDGAHRDLRDSYASTRHRLRLAGLHIDTAPLTDADVARVRALAGVEAAEDRLVVEVPVSPTPAGDRRATLRVLSLPDRGEPLLDHLLLVEGAWPVGDEVVLEKHFARHNGLGVGAGLKRPGGGLHCASRAWG
ncbi:MAG: hypothetical protein M3Y59_22835 [Myxococcota bacterium]|nr:hypothetical protein [Myxococcota bacterium]